MNGIRASSKGLLPCPFCGCEQLTVQDFADYIECDRCGAEGPSGHTVRAAKHSWNTRFQPIEGEPK